MSDSQFGPIIQRFVHSQVASADIARQGFLLFGNCRIQRPLDSRTQIRIALKAEAFLGVIHLIEDGEVELVSSLVLLFAAQRVIIGRKMSCG